MFLKVSPRLHYCLLFDRDSHQAIDIMHPICHVVFPFIIALLKVVVVVVATVVRNVALAPKKRTLSIIKLINLYSNHSFFYHDTGNKDSMEVQGSKCRTNDGDSIAAMEAQGDKCRAKHGDSSTGMEVQDGKCRTSNGASSAAMDSAAMGV